MLSILPIGQRRVAAALVEVNRGRTYPEVAAILEIHVGTVHRHLRRIRLRHPQIYRQVMAERRRQLTLRHQEALERAAAHSEQWRQSRFYRRYYRP